MGLFDGADLNKASLSGGGIRFTPGQYVVEIVDQTKVPTRKHGDAFSTRFKILEVVGDEKSNKVGSEADEFILMNLDWGPANAKRLLVAAYGLNAYSPEDAEAVASTNWNDKLVDCILKRDLIGNKVRVRCAPKKKRNSEEMYDRVQYEPHEETRAKMAARTKPAAKK